jgi:ABC-type sugar transport system ATPase subunit
MNLLSVVKLSKKIGASYVVRNVTLSVKPSQRIAIAGETGSGKSTLLRMMAGLTQPSGGEVVFDGHRVKGPEEVLVAGHPAIAYLSQLFELPKFLRVEQVLDYANTLSDKQATKLFKLCHIQHLLKRKTDELSGGERQRVALARQLLTQPRLLLLDEPYSNLDILHKNILKKVIDTLIAEVGITCLLVSHDPLDTLSFAEEMLVLQKGKVVQQGSPSTIYKKPASEYVAGLFGNFMVLQPKEVRALGGKSSRKAVIIRSEDLCVTPKGRYSAKGLVLQEFFYGGYKEILVESWDKNLLLRVSNEIMYKEGDSLYFSLAKAK